MLRPLESDMVTRAVVADRIARRLLMPLLFCAVLVLYAIGLLELPIGALIILFAAYLFSNELTMWLFRHRMMAQPGRLYTAQLILDTLLLVAAIHYTGGITSFAILLLPVIVILAGLVLPTGQCVLVTLCACLAFLYLVAAEAVGVVPYLPIAPPLAALSRHPGYTLMTTVTVVSILAVTAFVTVYLSDLARRHKRALEQARDEIEHWSRTLEERVRQRTGELTLVHQNLQRLYMDTVHSLLAALDAKDHYTQAHSAAVSRWATLIAKELSLSPKEIQDIKHACQLHDIGKIGIHDQILTKPGDLTPEEWAEMRLHPTIGAKILEPLTFLDQTRLMILQEHERYDGTGYPNRLKGEEICLGARIVAVADAYDAMVSQRPYNTPLSRQAAVVELVRCKGTQFDPRVVEAFIRVLEKLPTEPPPATPPTSHPT